MEVQQVKVRKTTKRKDLNEKKLELCPVGAFSFLFVVQHISFTFHHIKMCW